MKSTIQSVLTLFALLFFGGTLVLAGIFLYLSPKLPSAGQLRDVSLQTPLQIFTADNVLIAEYGEKHRLPVSYKDIPLQMKQAIIAAEDHRFYSHHGVDYIGIARAIKGLVVTGKKSQGASTITMQVARNFFLNYD